MSTPKVSFTLAKRGGAQWRVFTPLGGGDAAGSSGADNSGAGSARDAGSDYSSASAAAQQPSPHNVADEEFDAPSEKVDKVVLDPKEYDDSQWLEPETILAGDFHPALRFAVQSLLGVRKLAELQAAVAAQPDNDVEIAALARDLVRLTKTPMAEGTSDYRVVAPALGYECAVTTSFE